MTHTVTPRSRVTFHKPEISPTFRSATVCQILNLARVTGFSFADSKGTASPSFLKRVSISHSSPYSMVEGCEAYPHPSNQSSNQLINPPRLVLSESSALWPLACWFILCYHITKTLPDVHFSWYFQQPMILESCFDFLNILPGANGPLCNIGVRLPGNTLLCKIWWF